TKLDTSTTRRPARGSSAMVWNCTAISGDTSVLLLLPQALTVHSGGTRMAVQILRCCQEVRSTPVEAANQTLAQDIRTGILRDEVAQLARGAGAAREDGRLPTEAELARSYGVSRQTVRRAFQDLVAEGMVLRVPGRGTFVAPRRPYLRQFG